MKGKTWYEEYFGAVLDEGDVDRKKQIDRANQELEKYVSGEFRIVWKKLLYLGNYLRSEEWYKNIYDDIEKEYESCIGRYSWRYFFRQIFHKDGSIARHHGENIGCTLFIMMKHRFKEMFDIPSLDHTHWKISRETIQSYPEYNIEPAKNDSPIHTKQSDTTMKLNWVDKYLYTIGGKYTRKNKTLNPIPEGYGGVISFLVVKKHKEGKTRKNQTPPTSAIIGKGQPSQIMEPPKCPR